MGNLCRMSPDAQALVSSLGLVRHPEGGYYRETYRSMLRVTSNTESDDFPNQRSFSTAIYYLLCDDDFSALHRIKSDEIWHFYRGSTVIVYTIDQHGVLTQNRLGHAIENKEYYQLVVKAGCWFGAMLGEPNGYGLVGCTVSPGFDFRDFELANKDEMIKAYPNHRTVIERLIK
jgi:uncharacterized protein